MNTLFWFPGYVFLPTFAVLALISASCRRPFGNLVRTREFAWICSLLAGICLALFLALSIVHLASAGYGEQHSEGFAIKGLLILLGKPLYTDLHQSAERYSLLHGPNASLLFAAGMGLFGRSLFVCKLIVFLANLFTGLFTWLAFRSLFSPRSAFVLTGLALAPFLLIHSPAFITIRPDAFVNTLAALALWRVVTGKHLEQLVVLAVTTAVAVNFKINTVVCFLPLLFLISWPYRVWELFLAMVLGAAVVALPFAWPGVSFVNYVAWLRASSELEAGTNELPGAIHWFLLLGAPLILGVGIMWRSESGGRKYLFSRTGRFVLASLVSLLAMTGSATRIGASPSYFVPLLPGLFYAYGLLGLDIFRGMTASSGPTRKRNAATMGQTPPAVEWLLDFSGAIILTWVITGVVCAKDVFEEWQSEGNASNILYADVDRIAAALPGKSLSLGFGSTSTFFIANHRFRLVAAGQPYFLDATSLMSTNKARLPLPDATTELIRNKVVQAWLIPRGDDPFSIQNYYPPHDFLFDPAFRIAFRDNYHAIGHSSFFDVYEANP
jgi:hypothetical protein